MYEFLYDYIKSKYQNNAKSFYMDTGSVIIHIKTEDFHKYIADDVKKRYDTSNYEVDRALPKGMNKKVIGLMKDELEGKIMIQFVALRPKAYSYLTDDDNNVKKSKGTKKRMIKRIAKFYDYKNCLFKNEIKLKDLILKHIMYTLIKNQ